MWRFRNVGCRREDFRANDSDWLRRWTSSSVVGIRTRPFGWSMLKASAVVEPNRFWTFWAGDNIGAFCCFEIGCTSVSSNLTFGWGMWSQTCLPICYRRNKDRERASLPKSQGASTMPIGPVLMIELEELLSPIAEESPCGPDVSYDPKFLALDALIVGKPETQFSAAEEPDWKAVHDVCIELLRRSRTCASP